MTLLHYQLQLHPKASMDHLILAWPTSLGCSPLRINLGVPTTTPLDSLLRHSSQGLLLDWSTIEQYQLHTPSRCPCLPPHMIPVLTQWLAACLAQFKWSDPSTRTQSSLTICPQLRSMMLLAKHLLPSLLLCGAYAQMVRALYPRTLLDTVPNPLQITAKTFVSLKRA